VYVVVIIFKHVLKHDTDVPLSKMRMNIKRTLFEGGISNMNNNLVNEITASQLRNDLPEFSSGDEVKVSVRIVEGNKTRLQNFQGVVIARRGGGVSATFTVRKVSGGIGVERTFPVHSPAVASVQVVRRGKVIRNKITYIRKLSGKSARIKEIL
jgi:large subunit ribosomal protein L19